MKPVTGIRDGGRESQGFGAYIGSSIDEVVEASLVNNSGECTLSKRNIHFIKGRLIVPASG